MIEQTKIIDINNVQTVETQIKNDKEEKSKLKDIKTHKPKKSESSNNLKQSKNSEKDTHNKTSDNKRIKSESEKDKSKSISSKSRIDKVKKSMEKRDTVTKDNRSRDLRETLLSRPRSPLSLRKRPLPETFKDFYTHKRFKEHHPIQNNYPPRLFPPVPKDYDIDLRDEMRLSIPSLSTRFYGMNPRTSFYAKPPFSAPLHGIRHALPLPNYYPYREPIDRRPRDYYEIAKRPPPLRDHRPMPRPRLGRNVPNEGRYMDKPVKREFRRDHPKEGRKSEHINKNKSHGEDHQRNSNTEHTNFDIDGQYKQEEPHDQNKIQYAKLLKKLKIYEHLAGSYLYEEIKRQSNIKENEEQNRTSSKYGDIDSSPSREKEPERKKEAQSYQSDDDGDHIERILTNIEGLSAVVLNGYINENHEDLWSKQQLKDLELDYPITQDFFNSCLSLFKRNSMEETTTV